MPNFLFFFFLFFGGRGRANYNNKIYIGRLFQNRRIYIYKQKFNTQKTTSTGYSSAGDRWHVLNYIDDSRASPCSTRASLRQTPAAEYRITASRGSTVFTSTLRLSTVLTASLTRVLKVAAARSDQSSPPPPLAAGTTPYSSACRA